MPDALDSKLRPIVFAIVDAGPPPPPFADVEAVIAGVRGPAPAPHRTRTRSVIAAIATIALVATGLAVWSLTSARDDNRSVRSPATTVESGSRFGSGWSKDATFDGQVFAVATTASRSVAVGYGIWSSIDGHTWSRATIPEYGSGLDGSVVTDVVAHDGLFVAVGTGGDKQAAVWTSTDGTNWIRRHSAALAPRTPTVPEGTTTAKSSIASVAYTTHGYVAVGRVLQGGYGPMVWASPDGSHWRRVAGPLELQRVGPADGGLQAVTARGSTVVVAGQRTIWHTNDFEHWQAVTLPSAFLSTLAVQHGAMLAAGTSTDSGLHPTIWRSQDLEHWQTTYHGAPSNVTNITALIPSDTTVLALGYAGDQEVTTPGLLLESHDGRDWKPTQPPLPVPGQPTTAALDRDAFSRRGQRDPALPDGGVHPSSRYLHVTMTQGRQR